MKSKIFALSASIILGLVGMACANAQEAEQASQKIFSGDAEFISRHYDLPLEDVQRQLRLQNSRGNLIGDLREEFKDRLAGIYVEHYPVYRIVVRLTGNLQIPNRELKIGDDNLRIDFLHGQEYKSMDLQNALNNNWNKLRHVFKELQGGGTNEKTGEVELVIYMAEKNIEIIEEMHATAREILKVPVRIKVVHARARDFLSIIAGGSLPIIGCTSDFSVQHMITGTKGIITTDHCDPGNTTIYTGYENSIPLTLLHQGEKIQQQKIYDGTSLTLGGSQLRWSLKYTENQLRFPPL